MKINLKLYHQRLLSRRPNKKAGLGFIVFGFNDWDGWQGFNSRCSQVVKALAGRDDVAKVLIVSTAKSVAIRYWRSLFKQQKTDEEVLADTVWFSLRKATSKIYILDHFRLLPREEKFPFLLKLNGWLHDYFLRQVVRQTAKMLGMNSYVFWFANPLMVKHVGQLGERLAVFDAIDDWSVHPQKKYLHKTCCQAYKDISYKADLIFTVSPDLARKFGASKGEVCWLPNGVEVERFQRARAIELDLPRPRLGYVGVLQERVNVQLLEILSHTLPQASIILIGPVVSPKHFQKISFLPNVHFLGVKLYKEIPGWLKAMDVCLVPHYANSFTKSMNPLKIYEYLAAEKPVVATYVEGLEQFAEVVKLATTDEQFISFVQEALERPLSQSEKDKRAIFLRSRTWSAIAEQILTKIHAALST